MSTLNNTNQDECQCHDDFRGVFLNGSIKKCVYIINKQCYICDCQFQNYEDGCLNRSLFVEINFFSCFFPQYQGVVNKFHGIDMSP